MPKEYINILHNGTFTTTGEDDELNVRVAIRMYTFIQFKTITGQASCTRWT